VPHQPAISFSISIQHSFNRAGGRTSNVRVEMKTHMILISLFALTLSGCSESRAGKLQLRLPNVNQWYTVDHTHPAITDAARGIGRNDEHLVGARVKGEKGLVFYELYLHSPGYPIWKLEVARHNFRIDDEGSLSISPSGEGYQLLKHTTVDAADIPNRLEQAEALKP
jgi:hypothetical protein